MNKKNIREKFDYLNKNPTNQKGDFLSLFSLWLNDIDNIKNRDIIKKQNFYFKWIIYSMVFFVIFFVIFLYWKVFPIDTSSTLYLGFVKIFKFYLYYIFVILFFCSFKIAFLSSKIERFDDLKKSNENTLFNRNVILFWLLPYVIFIMLIAFWKYDYKLLMSFKYTNHIVIFTSISMFIFPVISAKLYKN